MSPFGFTRLSWVVAGLLLFVTTVEADGGKTPARGPLRVLKSNPRYFTDGSGKAVYLTGSHTWSSLQDLGVTNPPPAFDFTEYLNFLEKHRFNFIRLWRWELTEWKGWKEDKPPFRYGAQHPWKRTGPGKALDGKPKFDLQQWDDTHFERLRNRVRNAGQRGIYVSIMLFEGCMVRERPSTWAGHPMNAVNNINKINGDLNGDGFGLEIQMLQIPAITELQKAYIRKVVDTVNDLDNVLYEISNESLYRPEIVKWQVEMIQYINTYQAGKPKQHPVGMTALVGNSPRETAAANDALLASPADWISPGATAWGPNDPYSVSPPATRGRKVVILDSDHTWNNACLTNSKQQRADREWVWKAFLRGYNPIYMDPLDLTRPNAMMEFVKYNTAAVLTARTAMGRTRTYAGKMNLAAMTPQESLASTNYCLANPKAEYLVFQPGTGKFTVDMKQATGTFTVEWFNPRTSKTTAGATVTGGSVREFTPPVNGSVLLYLKAKTNDTSRMR